MANQHGDPSVRIGGSIIEVDLHTHVAFIPLLSSLFYLNMDVTNAPKDAPFLAHFVTSVFLVKRRKGSPDVSNPMTMRSAEYVQFRQFCERVIRVMKLGRRAVCYAMMMSDRFAAEYPNVHRIDHSHYGLFVSGMMMANKFMDDATYTNGTWSKMTGQPVQEINKMERNYLDRVQFNLQVDAEAFMWWERHMNNFEAEYFKRLSMKRMSETMLPLQPSAKRMHLDDTVSEASNSPTSPMPSEPMSQVHLDGTKSNVALLSGPQKPS